MKEQVLELLRDNKMKAHEKFNDALYLLRKHPHANPIAVRNFNQRGVSPEGLKNLLYDLKQVYKITDAEVRSKKQLVPQTPKKEKPETIGGLPKSLAEQLAEINIEDANYHKELKPLAADIADFIGVELENWKTETLTHFLQTQKGSMQDKLTDAPIDDEPQNPFEDAKQEAKEGLKLREEFPFLGKKDCPDKFKVLVADKLTAFENVLEAREDLLKNSKGETLSEAEVVERCKTAVTDLKLNQEIYDELNHYKETGEILGKHPIFTEEKLQEQVNAMKIKDVFDRKKNLENYIRRDEKKAAKIKDKAKKEALENKISDWQQELNLIDQRLESHDKK